MTLKKSIGIIVGFTTVISLAIVFYIFFWTKTQEPYKTEQPKRRDIRQIILATGTLSVKANIKIGSLVAGTIQKIMVKENQIVKKGQLLAEIDNGKADTDVKQTQGEIDRAQATLDYQTQFFHRQKSLYATRQISKDAFEKAAQDYERAKADLVIAQARNEKFAIEYGNTRIVAPTDGIIISIGISVGERVTTDLDATVLFEMAKDITKMEAPIEIDESYIGLVKPGMSATLSIETYPNKIFRGNIVYISFAPKKIDGSLGYKAVVELDNKHLLLRPGMTIKAKIKITEVKNVLAVPSHIFGLNRKHLEELAKELDYTFKPIKKEEKEKHREEESTYPRRYLWVKTDKSFEEKVIEVGATDEAYFEIKSGLNETDNLIVDIPEPDKMKQFYKKMFRRRL